MEAAFGADLSAVKLYESQAVADAGANAVAQGGPHRLCPGKLDFASASGQALLGHELSHVVSQARGEVSGSGFLRDAALETRADREGAMAAAGEQVYIGPVTAALSSASAAPAAGPMQARKPWEEEKPPQITDPQSTVTDISQVSSLPSPETYDLASYLTDDMRESTGFKARLRAEKNEPENLDPRRAAYLTMADHDVQKATPDQGFAFATYTENQADVNNYLRIGANSVHPLRLRNTTQVIQDMDMFFAKRRGLTQDMTVYRGIDDDFMKFLFSQAGFSKKSYSTKHRGQNQDTLDYDKIRKNGLLDRINKKGIKFQDKAFVSTSTSRGLADYYPKREMARAAREQIHQDILSHKIDAYKRQKGGPNAELTEDELRSIDLTPEEKDAVWNAALHQAMHTAGTHLMNIHLSDDVQAVAVDKMQKQFDVGNKPFLEQNEVLLNRGSKFKVTHIREVMPGRYEMDVEVLTPNGKKRVKQIMDTKKQRSRH